MKKKFYCLCMGMLLGISSVEAKVTLPSIISDNMVLQAQTKVCIWGKATPGENISVAPSWNEKSISTTAGKDGRWRVYISTPKASDNHSLTVKGENVITIRNVLIGEVWLCTGQSNMEFPVAHDPKVKWKTGMLGEAEVMKDDTLYSDVLQQFALKNVKRNKDYCKVPSTLWNGMIAPIAGYTVRGNIWYQGESNSIRAEKYQQVFTNMINSWRERWGQSDMPFYFMQIAPHYRQPAEIREAQLKTWRESGLKNVGMAVVVDAADSTDIHPRNKRVAGERLAAWALAKQYGKNVAYSGPVYKKMKIDGSRVILSFDYTEGGLKTLDGGDVKGFFISGEDERFYPAQAVIKGNKLELTSDKVMHPVAVRYGWGTFFRVNLCNGAGIPAVPFRTDCFASEKASRKFADSEMRRFPQAWQLDHGKRLFFGYAQGVGCCAMLDMWKATGDKRYFDYVEEWGDTIINDKGEIYKYDMATYNLDFINPGKVLFELYRETHDVKYKKAMDVLVKQLEHHPRTLKGGFWHKLVYQHQMWLDGLYMASPFLAQYGAEFNRPDLIDEAVKQFKLCHEYTYDARTGLYYHAWDESKSQRWANPETGHSPNFWGRSIGWWFMALVDALDYIPENHPGRTDMIGWIQGLAETLPKYQDKNGLWYQVIDQPKREGNFPEASVTSQCMYAYAKAVNKGYIDKKYRAVAEKAFKGLNDKLMRENVDGTLTLTRCCQVGGLGGNPYRDGSFEYYIGEKMRDNDAKATGPYIMGCLQLGY